MVHPWGVGVFGMSMWKDIKMEEFRHRLAIQIRNGRCTRF